MIEIEVRRFWRKVDKNGPIPEHKPELGNCWVWTGAKRPHGHGQCWQTLPNGTKMNGQAHRFSYRLHFGDFPDELLVCHKCDRGSCVRPDHLFLGTQTDNMQDCAKKRRTLSGEARPQSKLKESDVLEMRRLFSAGAEISEIHRLFPIVNIDCVIKIVRRQRWKHI